MWWRCFASPSSPSRAVRVGQCRSRPPPSWFSWSSARPSFPHPAYTPADAFRGFGHEALIAICSLMMLEGAGRHRRARHAGAPAVAAVGQTPAQLAAADAGGLRALQRLRQRHADRRHHAAGAGQPGVAHRPVAVASPDADELRGGRRHGHLVFASANLLVSRSPPISAGRRFNMFDFYPLVARPPFPPCSLSVALLLPQLLPERNMIDEDTRPAHL